LDSFNAPTLRRSRPDFLLQITDHLLEVGRAEAGAQELIPEPFALEAQAERLAGAGAVKGVEVAHRCGPAFEVAGGPAFRGMGIRLAHGWGGF
jgi:hypothetical protein